jgi:hypothetical protein
MEEDMIANGQFRRIGRIRYLPPAQRHEDALAPTDEGAAEELDRPRPGRRHGMVLGRTIGVAGGAFAVGFAQGRFGTSKVKGIPAELIAGGFLHATAACANIPEPARETLRALGDGALAAAALTLGYQVGLGRR